MDATSTTTSTTGGTMDATSTTTSTTGGTMDATSTTTSTTGGTMDATSTTTVASTSSTGEPASCFDTDETTGEGSTGAGETTGEPVVCPPIAGQPCTAPIDCDGLFCGSQISVLDEHGCPRAVCAKQADCGPGEVCGLKGAEGGVPVCVEQNGACVCTLEGDFTTGVCLPAELVDIGALCPTLTSEEDCARFDVPHFDYCEWTAIEQFCPGTCGSRVVHRCVHFSYHGEGCTVKSACPGRLELGYTREGPLGPELLITTKCEDDPPGWEQCEGGDPEVCACRCTLP